MSHAKEPEAPHPEDDGAKPAGPLRYGWTTGACATAAAKAAFIALITEEFPDPVSIVLPKGQTPAFALAFHDMSSGEAMAGVIKDAGDDPDATHGALVKVTVKKAATGGGIQFRAGEGVGTVTRAGLALPPGEPAINPAPRAMISANLQEVAAKFGEPADLIVEISIPDGEKIAERTLNPRLGIIGGLSILGTTGIVVPYSCSAWIHSIYRGIDVARAGGLTHVAGATGRTSETAVSAHHALPDEALIDMGDFVGGMLKYMRKSPIDRVTIAGGVAKMTKLAQGFLDLHSRRGRVDMDALAETAGKAGADDPLRQAIAASNTTAQAFDHARMAGINLGTTIAHAARKTAVKAIRDAPIDIEILIFDRDGKLVAESPFTHDVPSPGSDTLNRRS